MQQIINFQLEVNPAGLHRDLVVHAPIIVGSIPLRSTFQDFIGEKREDLDTPLQMYPDLGEKLFHVTSLVVSQETMSSQGIYS